MATEIKSSLVKKSQTIDEQMEAIEGLKTDARSGQARFGQLRGRVSPAERPTKVLSLNKSD